MAYNPTLETVMRTRQTQQVWKPISIEETPTKCLVALPYGYKHLIGEKVYFQSDFLYGPYLVVDVENINHKGQMFNRKLSADTNCKELVHKKGYIFTMRRSHNISPSMYYN